MPPLEAEGNHLLHLSPSLSPPQYKHRRRAGLEKSVSFSESLPDVQSVKCRDEYSPAERGAVWYSNEDFKDFRQNCKTVVDAIDGMSSSYSSDMEVRGVERMTREASNSYRELRTKLLDCLEESDCDSDEIAYLLSQYTSCSVQEAQILAKLDQEFAMQHLGVEPRSPVRRRKSGVIATRCCSLPSLSPRRNNSMADPGIRSRRKMRAETGRLFREEYIRRLSLYE